MQAEQILEKLTVSTASGPVLLREAEVKILLGRFKALEELTTQLLRSAHDGKKQITLLVPKSA
jgi:hypothetical protein